MLVEHYRNWHPFQYYLWQGEPMDLFDDSVARWSVAVDASDYSALPQPWRSACDAVRRDLNCLRYGRLVSFADMEWSIILRDGEFVTVYLAPVDGLVHQHQLGGVGRGMPDVDTVHEATYYVAEFVQDNLAGDEFVQWPSRGRVMFTPALRGGRAVWLDGDAPTRGAEVADIGSLCV